MDEYQILKQQYDEIQALLAAEGREPTPEETNIIQRYTEMNTVAETMSPETTVKGISRMPFKPPIRLYPLSVKPSRAVGKRYTTPRLTPMSIKQPKSSSIKLPISYVRLFQNKPEEATKLYQKAHPSLARMPELGDHLETNFQKVITQKNQQEEVR